MMKELDDVRCSRARRWVEAAGDQRKAVPPELAGHMAGCPDCRGLLLAYERLVEVGRSEVPAVARHLDFHRLEAALATPEPRRTGRTWAPWALAAALAAVALGGWLFAPGEGESTLRNPAGSAGITGPQLKTLGGAILPDRPGEGPLEADAVALRPGESVQTTEARAILSDPAIGTFVLATATRVRLESWEGGSAALLLESGRIDASVLHREAGESVEVRTSFLAVRVIGTRFTVIHRPDAGTDVSVEEGEVALESPPGTEIARLRSGNLARVGPDGLMLSPPAVAQSGTPATNPANPATPCTAERPADTPSAGATPRVRSDARPGPAPARPKVDALEQVRALIVAGQADAAAALLAGVREASPEERRRLLALLGDVYRIGGQFEAARTSYEQSLALWPESPPEGLFLDLATVLGQPLQRPEEAAAVWTRYLDAHPRGQFAGRALLALSDRAEARGERARAEALVRRMVEVAPEATETLPAVVRIGRRKLASHDLDGAAEWFSTTIASDVTPLSEAGVVGLIRTRLEQGRYLEVRELAAEYRRRFPAGLRKDEVSQVVDRLPAPAGQP